MFVFILFSAIIQACLFNFSGLMADSGISSQNATIALLLHKPANLIGLLVTGWLLDRVPAHLVVALSLAAITLGFSLLLVGVSSVSTCIAAALIGIGAGAETVALPYLISLYFGLRAFGEIYSYLLLTLGVGRVLGSVLMTIGYNLTGSYQLALSLCYAPMLVAAVLLLRLRLFQSFKE
jgi:MFS family permease